MEILQIAMQSEKIGIITTAAALVLVISMVSTITPYSVLAKSNTENSTSNNDCHANVFSIFVGVQQQVSARLRK